MSRLGTKAFDDLPLVDGLRLRHAWDELDRDLGTLSRITPATVARAAESVREGVTLGLNLPITEPSPPLFSREPVKHEIFEVDRNTLDDRLDSFYPQASSQWDGLRHIRAREYGFFGGFTEDFAPGPGPLGIEAWSNGIVGRGVLLDVVRLRERQGRSYDALGAEAIEAADLAEAAADQGVELAAGDVICIRTGWIEAYRELTADGRVAMAAHPRITGLAGSEAVARLLWDSGAAAVAADNPTLEVSPGDPAVGSLHRRLIPLLGFAVAELLDLGPLAVACAANNRWDFLFVAVPLNLPGGIGSPANAVAIR